MKAYGLPRLFGVEYPDMADIWYFGRKGYRMFNKKGTRRIWKKKERAKIKADIKREIENVSQI